MSSCFDKLSTNGCCWVPSPLVGEGQGEGVYGKLILAG